MIESITTEVISSTCEGGPLWFHPRACAVPRAGGAQLVMTGQSISGSDVFGHVHWMTSTDGGRSWSDPEPVPELGRRLRDDGIEDGVNDPDGVPRMGNFHTTAVSPDESIVTVGECLPSSGYQGETLLARVRWRRPNRLFV